MRQLCRNGTLNLKVNYMSNDNQFSTLHCVFDAIYKRVSDTHYSSPELENYLHTGGISYGTVWGHSFELITPRVMWPRKASTLPWNAREQGLYILNSYIL